MTTLQRAGRSGAVILALVAAGACSNANLGDILGGVLGGSSQGGQGNQVSGTVQGVDTRAQQIVLQLSNGQSVGLAFDNQTQVVYQNQSYPVTSLERGDRVTARIQSTNNGGYYTDLVQVDQSVSSSTSSSGNVQSFQGTVRQVDRANGLFSLDVNNYGTLTVALPYNPRRADVDTFQNLRSGQYVRLYGVFLNNSRVELREFY
jgi:hypothetical protein